MPAKIRMEVFYPKDLYDENELGRIIENTLNTTAAAVKVDFGVTTRTWSKRPSFRIRKKKWEREISTDSDVYKFLDFGTKKNYPIRPKKAARLRFQWGGPGSYKPKTLVRKIYSRGGGPSGPIVTAKEVTHPGIEARDFSEVIAEKWNDELPAQMQRAISAELAR